MHPDRTEIIKFGEKVSNLLRRTKGKRGKEKKKKTPNDMADLDGKFTEENSPRTP